MALFDFLKKKKEEEPAEEKEKGPWELAYQANPQAYQNEEGKTMLVFTLTEGTDTILPMDPVRMYQIGGKPAEDIRLGFCSLKEDRIIASLPFYACVHALSAYVNDTREPFVMVRGLSHEELLDITAEVSCDIESRGHLQKAFEKNLEFIGLDHTDKNTVSRVFAGEKVQTFTFENVRFPSGTLIVSDPLAYLPDSENTTYLEETVAGGEYPVILSVVHPPHDSTRIAGMKLQVSGNEAAEYRPAETWFSKNGMRRDGLMGFAVETGLASIADDRAAEAFWQFLKEWKEENPGANLYNDYFAELFQKSYEEHPELQREGGDFIRWQIPGSEEEIVMCASGYGDGYYSTFCGYDREGKLCEIVMMFLDPKLYEEEENED